MNMRLFDALCAHLKEHDINFDADEAAQMVTFNARSDTVTSDFAIEVDEDKALTLLAQLPLLVEPAEQMRVLDLVNRANHSIRFGKFLFNDKNRVVAFSHATMVRPGPDDMTFVYLILTSMHTVDRWFPAFGTLLNTTRTPEEIVNEVLAAEQAEEESTS